MLYICLVFSAILLLVVNGVALLGGKPGLGWATLLAGAAIVPLLMCGGGNFLLPLNALLIMVVGVVCFAVGARPRRFLVASLAVTVAAYGMVCLSAIPQIWQWNRLKSAYPMESLAARLAYEDRRPGGAIPGRYSSERLAFFEDRIENEEGPFRRLSLEQLHAGVVEQFVNNPGFGVGRWLRRPDPSRLREIDLRRESEQGTRGPIPQPSRSYVSPEPAAGDVTAAESDFGREHEDNAVAFLNPRDFGYARDREHVAGFRPHQFRRQPEAPKRWQVARLELVGLLKYEEPVVYLSDNLPKMDELRDAPTRPLDAFEQQALTALRGGEDLMVQDRPDRMRMLGSLRAAEQCVRCHDVERGELLGAFTYQLVREAPRD